MTILLFAKGLLAHLVHDLVADCEKLGHPMTKSGTDHAEAEWVSSYETAPRRYGNFDGHYDLGQDNEPTNPCSRYGYRMPRTRQRLAWIVQEPPLSRGYLAAHCKDRAQQALASTFFALSSTKTRFVQCMESCDTGNRRHLNLKRHKGIRTRAISSNFNETSLLSSH